MLRAVDINDLALIGQSSANLTSPARRAETVKAFAARGERLSKSPRCLAREASLHRSFTVCLRLLVAQAYSLQAGRSLFGFERPALSAAQPWSAFRFSV